MLKPVHKMFGVSQSLALSVVEGLTLSVVEMLAVKLLTFFIPGFVSRSFQNSQAKIDLLLIISSSTTKCFVISAMTDLTFFLCQYSSDDCISYVYAAVVVKGTSFAASRINFEVSNVNHGFLSKIQKEEFRKFLRHNFLQQILETRLLILLNL